MCKKKGQISLEMIIILGILVLGAIIFSIIFLTNVREQARSEEDVDMDSFIEDFKRDLNQVTTSGPNKIIQNSSINSFL